MMRQARTAPETGGTRLIRSILVREDSRPAYELGWGTILM